MPFQWWPFQRKKNTERGQVKEGWMELKVRTGEYSDVWEKRMVRVDHKCLTISEENDGAEHLIIPLNDITTIPINNQPDQEVLFEWGVASVFMVQIKDKRCIQLRVPKHEETTWKKAFRDARKTAATTPKLNTATPSPAPSLCWNDNKEYVHDSSHGNYEVNSQGHTKNLKTVRNLPKDRQQELGTEVAKLEYDEGPHGNTGNGKQNNGEVINGTDDPSASASEQNWNQDPLPTFSTCSVLTPTQTHTPNSTSNQDVPFSTQPPPFPKFGQQQGGRTVELQDNINQSNHNHKTKANSSSPSGKPEGMNESITKETFQSAPSTAIQGKGHVNELVQLYTRKQNTLRSIRSSAPTVPPKPRIQLQTIPEIQPGHCPSLAPPSSGISDNVVRSRDDNIEVNVIGKRVGLPLPPIPPKLSASIGAPLFGGNEKNITLPNDQIALLNKLEVDQVLGPNYTMPIDRPNTETTTTMNKMVDKERDIGIQDHQGSKEARGKDETTYKAFKELNDNPGFQSSKANMEAPTHPPPPPADPPTMRERTPSGSNSNSGRRQEMHLVHKRLSGSLEEEPKTGWAGWAVPSRPHKNN